jgi:exo-beta-1,3-glucanase (GH17 family)
MSYRNSKKVLSLTGVDVDGFTSEELHQYFLKTLEAGMHGLCFSAYEEGQEPGDTLNYQQVEKRLNVLKPYTGWIRTFSTTEGNELIAKASHKLGLKTLVGAWLSDDLEKNEEEINALIELAKAGFVNIAAVGNEVLYRKELEEHQLIDYLKRVKEALPDIPVGYVDAYYEFENRPAITAACDVILANCYPFWEGCPLEYSLLYMKDMYRRAQKADPSKKVIITETGWPSQGENFNGSYPSHENAIRYFLNTQKWSQEEDIDIFYFSSFDESWKVGDEGNVGAYWGIWDKDGKLKY